MLKLLKTRKIFVYPKFVYIARSSLKYLFLLRCLFCLQQLLSRYCAVASWSKKISLADLSLKFYFVLLRFPSYGRQIQYLILRNLYFGYCSLSVACANNNVSFLSMLYYGCIKFTYIMRYCPEWSHTS